ncbi:MarR family winged helix-turn-helix transcriptional regulator [Geodermatophilus sp. DSM 45219]|uniref:MarR family winged helix-turn-helix transcriptional regulator n=1 Tax=Geodermatophilus sp. DSM 45219 TaxID=1881103 RepID=UPI000886E7B8|nr:MarR family transcriptional regulator [Geodermatophilus sp. DSM 45219]SDN72847.1 DNA-binding transcriptional regulator, MarR family [Geodermatophilus sp. DSM 45219]
MTEERQAPATVHRLRALTLLLDAAGADFAARHGLTATDVRALVCLLDRERAGVPASPTWLAGELRLTTASVTALLDRLERAGHVRRAPRTDDRRRVDVTVQDSAKALGWAFFGPLFDAAAAVLDRRSAAERAVIDAFLDDMVAAVQAVDSSGTGGQG